MHPARIVSALSLFAALSVLGLSACKPLLQPCFSEKFDDDGNLADGNRLDGSWYLNSVDGQAVGFGALGTGYRLPPDPKKPLDPPKFLRYGQLFLETEDAGFDNDCKSLIRSEGSILVSYAVTSAATSAIGDSDRKSYSARFHNNHETSSGYVGAGQREAPMTVTSVNGRASRITIRAVVDLFAFDITYTLVFGR